MSDPLPRERRRARVAYALGRVAWALPRALALAIPLALLAMFLNTRVAPFIIGGAVFAVVGVAGWRSRGALVGAVLGVGACAAASCVVMLGLRDCSSLEAKVACIAVGGVVGTLIGALSGKMRGSRFDIVVGAFAGCALHVLLGCAIGGIAEAIGLIAGVAIGVVPGFAVLSRSRA